jgi:hypothetical protein
VISTEKLTEILHRKQRLDSEEMSYIYISSSRLSLTLKTAFLCGNKSWTGESLLLAVLVREKIKI